MAIEAQLFDGTILEFPDDTERSVIDSTVKKLTLERQPKEKESPLRQVADIPLKFTEGVVSGVRMLSDAFGADNSISKSLRGVEDYVGGLLSAQAKNDQKEIARIMKEAEDKGVLEQIKAGFSALTVAPIDLMAQVFGTAIPTLAGGLAGAGLRVGAKALTGAALNVGAKTTGALTGAVMGAGTGKSAIYDAVVEELSKANLPKEVIEQAATTAQEYGGKNLDLILANTLLGGVAGSTGLEKALIPGMSKRISEKVAQRGALTRGAAAGFPEGGTEFLQGGTEQASKNIALQREGYDVPTMRGVYSAGTMEGLAGFGVGAAAGAMRRPTATEPPVVEPSITEQPPLAPEPFTPTVIPQAYSTQEGIDRATGVVGGGGYTAADLLTPGAEGVREQAQQMATRDLNAVGTPRPRMTEEGRLAAQQAAFARADQEQGFTDQRQPMPVSPSQAVPYTAPAPVSIEERRKLADAQSEQLAQAQNEPFAFDRRRLEASASTVGGTGQVRGEPRAVLADPNPMVPRAARQRLAVMKEDAVANGEDPNALVIVPHPTMGGRFAIEQRSMEQPYVAPPIEAPTVSQAEAQRRIEASALAGSEKQRLAQDNPRQNMISRAMANIKARGGVASPYEAQLLREANMGQPFNSIDQKIPPPSGSLQGARQERLEEEYQAELAAGREEVRKQGPNQPIQTTPTVESPEAIEAERQARNKSDLAQQQRRLLELQQQRLTEQQNREEAGAAKAAKPVEIPSPDAVIGALRTPAPLRSAEESSLVSRAKSLMPAAEFNALQRAGEEDFNILQRAANAPATMSMQDKARLNVIREGRASLASEPQVATPEAKAMADEVRKKLLPVLKRFGLEKMGLRLVDSISNGAEGMYFKSVITLALDNENPMGVMRHEVIHALKELGAFTNGEWKVLTDMAKKKWINQFYSPELQAQYKAQYEKDGDTTQTFDEYMAEEAIAQAFRFYTETKPPSGMIANLMRRLNNVFQAIREFFMGNGVTSAEQLFLAKSIFSNIESGRMTAGRAGVQPKTAPAYSLKDTSSLENSFEMARSKNYAKNRDFKIELQAAVLDAAEKEGIDLSSTADEVTKHLIDVGTKDAEFAMKSNANAIGWYDKTVSKALAIVSLMHPEIRTNPEAKLAFTWGLAVTSNGIKVDKNFELAEQVYAYYKKHKKMPTNIAAGEATDSINKGLKAFNDLSKKWTPSELRQFMATEMPAGLVSKITGMKVTGENATTNVLGAAILGPKIGNGFFSNLNGIFDQLTMDRWLMRTWGRWTGSLIDSKPEQINKSTETLKNLVDKILNDPVTLANYEPLIKQKITAADLNDDASVQALAKKIVKASVKPENRTEFNKTPVGEEIRKAANNLEGYLDGQKEAPENGTERTYIREVFNGILDNVRKQGHKDMTMADLQALLWYPERRLYDAGKESDVETGYADDEAPDYANAATKIALKNKVPKALIDTAAKEAEIGYERRAEAVRRGSDRGASDAVGRGVGFTGKARKNFATRGVIQSYLERNSTEPKAFKRKSPKDGESLRVLRQDVIAEYSPEVSFNNALKSVGSESPKFYELTSAGAQTFQTAIQNAKNNNAFGAAVTVYPEEDYAKMRLFVSKDGKAGFALKGDDIVSVFSQPPHSGGVNGIMQLATQLGGRRLDAFDTILPDLYFNNGFTVVARIKWNNEYIPEGWSKQRFQEFNNGEPDVVFMAYDPKVKERPTNKQGVYIDDYDASVALQQKQSKGKKYGKYSLKPEQLALRPSDSSGRGVTFNDRKEDATSYAGSHYGKTKTNILSGGYYGTGLKGAEAKRLAQSKDSRIGKRIYFYIPRANGTMPMRESGVGNHVYTQKFDNILGPGKTMSELYKKAQGDSNAFESFVIDNGYDGYAVPDYGMMVVLNNDIEAKYEGTVGDVHYAKLEGKASLRTPPALLKQTLTDSFKRWFGKSAIVDMNGDPKVMYHGTARDITEFRAKQAGAIFVTDRAGFAEDFTDASQSYMVKELFNGMSEGEKVALLKKALKLAKKDKSILKQEAANVEQYIKTMPDSTFGMVPSGIEAEVRQLLDDALPSRRNILPVFVRAERPFDYENPQHIASLREIYGDDEAIKDIKKGNWQTIESPDVQEAIRYAGYDGFYIKEGGVKNLAVYDPNQLKSAIGNTGAFSPESKDIRYSLTNNAPPAVHTKLVPNQSAGQQVTAAATNAIKAVREDGYFTKLRDGIVDDTSTLGNTLANQGMSQFAKNKLRADMLKHTQSNSINIMTVGLQSGVPVLNTDGSIIIKRTKSNIARSLILADKLDSNPYVKASKLKGGRGFVAEVARALRGADIKEEDAAMNAEGQKLIADADKLEASLNAAVKAGGQDVSAITSAKTKIDKLRKEGKELAGKNREKQVDDAQIQWAEAQLKNVPELKEIFGIWKDVNDALTDLSEDTGIISKEQAQKYRDKKFYVPLFKAREDLAESFFHGSSAKNVAKNYKLEGADIDRNIWENIQKQYAMTIAVAYENQTRKTAIEQLQGFGLAKTVDNPNDPNINLRYKEDGKIVHAIAENPNDIVAFQMMNYELGAVMKFISGTTKVLRFGALVNPMFWFKQLIRDPIHASLTNNQIVTPFHSAVAFAKILNNSSESAKILAERGVIGAVDSTVDLNEYLGQLGKEKKTPQMLSSLMHNVMRMHESSDAATRVAIFESAKKEALKKGMNEEEAINFAVFRARESINFGVKGNSQTLNVLRHSIPFFQAAITSLDTVYRAATGYGLPPAERRKAQLTFAKRAAVMGLMSTMYAMMYTDDDEYKDLPDYVKDGNWLFPTTTPDGRKTFVKIPVPFEIGFLFKTLPEAGWRWYSGTSTGKEVAKSVKDGLIHNIPGGGTIVPQAFKPALEVIMNHSLFTGNPIEGMSDQGLPVAERGRNASEFAKATSKAGLDSMGLSPAKIDALIKGYFAELGATFLAVTSDLIGTDKPTKNIEANLVAKSFMTDPKVSKAVSDFYTLEHNTKEMTNMFAKLKKEGLFDTAREYLEDDDKKKQMLAAPVFRKIGEQLGQIKTEIKRVENREGMDADEKRTRINELQKLLAQTAKKGYDVAERAGIAR